MFGEGIYKDQCIGYIVKIIYHEAEYVLKFSKVILWQYQLFKVKLVGRALFLILNRNRHSVDNVIFRPNLDTDETI